MKKTFAILAAVLFVLSFAASAFAIHAEIPAETQAVIAKGATQITLGGEIRFRGWYNDNLGVPFSDSMTGIPQAGNSKANYDGRLRLSLDAKVSPNVQGFVQLESNAGSADTYTWGNFNAKPTDLHILQSWIQYTGSGLFGIPAGLKVGHMPLKLSEGQFFDHTQWGDDAIVFFLDPTKQIHIGLLAIKFTEGFKGDNTDDTDGYVGLMNFKINDKNTVGVNWTFLNRPDGSPFDPTTEAFKFHNLGVFANGGAGNFGYKGELDVQFGSVSDAVSDDKAKFRGYGLMLGANFKMNPVNLRGSLAYGSGDKDSEDDKIGTFQTFVGTLQHYTFVYDYRATTTAGGIGTGISNTLYFNVGADFQATKDIMLSLDGYLLRAAKTNNLVAVGGGSVSKNAGWEIDASFKYNVARNLTYAINAGYFKTGKFYDDLYENDKKGATVINNVLTLSF